MAGDVPPPLGPISIYCMVEAVASSTSTPSDGRHLLAEFVRQANNGNVDRQLIEHVRDCLTAFLTGQRPHVQPMDDPPEINGVLGSLVDEAPPDSVVSMEQAFGMKLGRGRPRIDDEERTDVAMEVLKARLAGGTYEAAIGDVAEARKRTGLAIHGDTEVRNVWTTNRVKALRALVIYRGLEGRTWTADEQTRLRKIYKNLPQFDFTAEK